MLICEPKRHPGAGWVPTSKQYPAALLRFRLLLRRIGEPRMAARRGSKIKAVLRTATSAHSHALLCVAQWPGHVAPQPKHRILMRC